MTVDIFYQCDREKCENCSDECQHTSDITHAVYFEKKGEAYFEKDSWSEGYQEAFEEEH